MMKTQTNKCDAKNCNAEVCRVEVSGLQTRELCQSVHRFCHRDQSQAFDYVVWVTEHSLQGQAQAAVAVLAETSNTEIFFYFKNYNLQLKRNNSPNEEP